MFFQGSIVFYEKMYMQKSDNEQNEVENMKGHWKKQTKI